jgi:hypothetical protein
VAASGPDLIVGTTVVGPNQVVVYVSDGVSKWIEVAQAT